ncbi:MAG: precorrin-6y C5,15-methyltransferase (decarboxylating) subunit CbiE [Coriobacteriia bacterium]|nr:precorrin-6y C5,15-methyltransferase (decarboxylating) subunit CbiE [Coriobacteriia bacterium]
MSLLTVIGYGPGSPDLLTGQAQAAIDAATRVLSTERLSTADPRVRGLSLSGLLAELEDSLPDQTAVLVSGDSGFYSLARRIVAEFEGRYQIELLPGIGSIQYFSALIKVPYDDAALVSLHGRDGNIVARAAYNQSVFALTGGEHKAADIIRELYDAGLGQLDVAVGERLSYADQRLSQGTVESLLPQSFDGLAVLYISNPGAVNPHLPLGDDDFTRGDVPMTKAEVRWLSLMKLGIAPGETCYDIGAGSGSVSVEMARRAFQGRVFAIEMKAAACDLVLQNIRRLGAYNATLVRGEAPAALAGLPVPDKAFIGGSSGSLDSIIEALLAANPHVHVVINAISLQTLGQAQDAMQRYGFGAVETICVNIAKAARRGNYDLMTAQNPVYIISGTAGGL